MPKKTHQNGHKLRPLSQMGLIRVPSNAKARIPDQQTAGNALDAFNDKIADDRYLHATKGWRTFDPKRGRAQAVMSEIRQGMPSTLASRGRFIATGRP